MQWKTTAWRATAAADKPMHAGGGGGGGSPGDGRRGGRPSAIEPAIPGTGRHPLNHSPPGLALRDPLAGISRPASARVPFVCTSRRTARAYIIHAKPGRGRGRFPGSENTTKCRTVIYEFGNFDGGR
ncbi:hypothetical protein MTP99_001960 [Tenebrio molitor]|nr:hypothetical protein MTP99_001960 [Tenebrio molitor]